MASNTPADEIFAQYGAPTTDSAPASPAMTPADEVFAQYGPKNPGGLGKQPDLWGKWTALANGYLQGFGTKVKAAGAAAGETVKNLEHGGKLSDAIPDFQNYYGQAKDIYGAARQQYNTANPILGPSLEAVGSIPSTLALMSAGGGILSKAGSVVADAVPALGDAGNALASAGNAVNTAAQGNFLARAVASGVKAIPSGVAAAGITSGLNDSSTVDQMKSAAPLSMAFGTGGSIVGDAAHAIGQKIVGSNIGEDTASLAQKAINQYGIPLRADHLSNSPFMKYMGSELENVPFSGYAGKAADAKAAFTRAVTRSFGQDTDTVTPDMVKSAFKTIGQKFDAVAANTPAIPLGEDFQQKLAATLNDARGVLPSNEVAPIEMQVSNMLAKAKGGEIDGRTYQALVQRGGSLDNAMKSPNKMIAQYATQIRSALDDALESVASPEDTNLLREARYQYKNLKTVQPLLDKAGSTGGHIEPALLLQRARSGYGNSFSTGDAGELGDLARIGQTFMKSPPNSGTAQRGVANKIIGAVGGPVLAGGAAIGAGLPAAGAAALLGMGTGRLIGGAMDNPLTRNAIIRAGINNGAAPGFTGNTLQSLIAPAGVIATNRLSGQTIPHPSN